MRITLDPLKLAKSRSEVRALAWNLAHAAVECSIEFLQLSKKKSGQVVKLQD